VKVSPHVLFVALATLAVSGAIIAGVIVLGGPARVRAQRLDDQRVRDLRSLSMAVENYRRTHDDLPEDLEAMPNVGWPNAHFRDPASGAPYEYAVKDHSSYELCATFDTGVDERTDVAVPDSPFWKHPRVRLRAEHSKNKRPRVVMLRRELRALLERRAARRRLECTFVFHRDGKRLGDFRKAWRTACKAAGIVGCLFHDLRRSAVRNMVRAQVPERVAMAVSGHKTRAVFDRYNIVSEDDLAAAAERTAAYLTECRECSRRVVPLGREHGQNTDNFASDTQPGTGENRASG
jgi:hypothetical protein